MKYQLINFLAIIKPQGLFTGGDVQQLPLPHGGHQLLGIGRDGLGRLGQENLYVVC